MLLVIIPSPFLWNVKISGTVSLLQKRLFFGRVFGNHGITAYERLSPYIMLNICIPYIWLKIIIGFFAMASLELDLLLFSMVRFFY